MVLRSNGVGGDKYMIGGYSGSGDSFGGINGTGKYDDGICALL